MKINFALLEITNFSSSIINIFETRKFQIQKSLKLITNNDERLKIFRCVCRLTEFDEGEPDSTYNVHYQRQYRQNQQGCRLQLQNVMTFDLPLTICIERFSPVWHYSQRL